jgi:PKD repeat protein
MDAELLSLTGSPGYHPLSPYSPAIDAGNPDGCEDHLGIILVNDQRGMSRVGRCDIGSYEYNPANPPLFAEFTATPTTGIVPLITQFTNTSLGEYAACYWDFGDESTSEDCDDPTHTYDEAGTFTVRLTIQGADGEHTATQTDYIMTKPQPGQIIVNKVTDPSGEPQSFQFTIRGGPEDIDKDFSLTDAAEPWNSGDLPPGTYTVNEIVPTGWVLDAVSCDDQSDPSSIELEAAETVTCTFSNRKQGQIIVDKITEPRGDPQPFSFTMTGVPVVTAGNHRNGMDTDASTSNKAQNVELIGQIYRADWRCKFSSGHTG